MTSKHNERVLNELVALEENKYCADCGVKGPRWASFNIGAFLCMRCGGMHRKMGTHISKIKSITLDKWTDEQVQVMVANGNAKVNSIYLPNPRLHPPPVNSDMEMEQYIRDKYERKLFAREAAAPAVQSTPHSVATGSGHSQPAPIFTVPATSAANSARNTTAADEHHYATQLKQMADMGFTDKPRAVEALKQTHGNVAAAVEMILAQSSGKDTYATQLMQMKAMGFGKEDICIQALMRSQGNVEAAVNLMLEWERTSGPSTPLSATTAAPQPQSTWPSSQPSRPSAPSQPSQPQAAFAKKEEKSLLDLFDDPPPAQSKPTATTASGANFASPFTSTFPASNNGGNPFATTGASTANSAPFPSTHHDPFASSGFTATGTSNANGAASSDPFAALETQSSKSKATKDDILSLFQSGNPGFGNVGPVAPQPAMVGMGSAFPPVGGSYNPFAPAPVVGGYPGTMPPMAPAGFGGYGTGMAPNPFGGYGMPANGPSNLGLGSANPGFGVAPSMGGSYGGAQGFTGSAPFGGNTNPFSSPSGFGSVPSTNDPFANLTSIGGARSKQQDGNPFQ